MSTVANQPAKLRVCLVADTLLHEAGTEKLMAEIAKRIDPSSHEVYVCCFETSPRLQELPDHIHRAVFPVQVLYHPAGLRQLLAFRRYLVSNQIDLVQGFMTKANIFVVLAALGLRKRAVITSRVSTGYWYTPRLRVLYKLLDRFTTRIFTNAACAQRVTIESEGVTSGKVYVVYTGVDLVKYGVSAGAHSGPNLLGIPAHARVIGIVATYRPVKDLALFLQAARHVADRIPDAVFMLVGHGALESDLQKLARELGIEQRVFFSKGQGTVPDHLSRMSIACLSSQSEGLPNSILEYMAARLPVVAMDVGGISELVEDGVTGFLVRERTPQAFAQPIIRLLQDEDLRQKMASAGLERCRREFDIAAAAKRLEQFYRGAMEEVCERRVEGGASARR